MKFYVIDRYGSPPADKPPYCVLRADNWDDYTYKTTFHLSVYLKGINTGEIVQESIGTVKILNQDLKTTTLSPVFETLDSNFCSLGQEPLYYEKLSSLKAKTQKEILKALKDVVYDPDIYRLFKDNQGFKTSLLRFSPAEKALAEGQTILNKTKSDNFFKFTFKFKLESFENEHHIDFDFDYNDLLPFRINALVGKNGAGKTQCMTRLANVLSKENKSLGYFDGNSPLFDKVIAISYSAFDNIVKPVSGEKFSYKYCGLQDDSGVLNKTKLKEKINIALEEIHSLRRNSKWIEVLYELMSHNQYILNFNSHQGVLKIEDIFPNENLSSGQMMILSIVTDIIANIRRESLILFDEPENHLHPNATSTILKVFYKILEDFNSFAIICTHSPLILAEIPRKYIRVVDKVLGRVDVRMLDIETFGGNLNDITSNVFNVIESESMYKSKLLEISRNKSFDEVMRSFENKLSLGAQLYLKSLYKGRT
ncbi:AAA family ATPase [Peredibacter starrii]|uniref:AAA family ATPase n=1 Tax=Peredibacter starrii TaxID=28202 RepID=A0AAX4HRG7_9BACT|nr:AAA family ATPase [Peredibacter starrii]WPU65901.1 AAA family ATPase [Peredibacter starrii]